MKDGFVKAAALTPQIRVADCGYNGAAIRRMAEEACREGAKLLVFPELCVTGYTCGDLFWQETLLLAARRELGRILEHSRGMDALIFVGLPWEKDGKLYNVAAAVSGGRLLGLVPKRFLPNYNEFYERRHFTPAPGENGWVRTEFGLVPFGQRLLFACEELPELVAAAELCEDLWAPNPPGVEHALAGAAVLVNLSASDEATGKSLYRRQLVASQSARLLCGYVYASAGEGESTQDLVFSGHNLIAENGAILAESPRFGHGILYSELDVRRLTAERRRMTTFEVRGADGYLYCPGADLSRLEGDPYSPMLYSADNEEGDAPCSERYPHSPISYSMRFAGADAPHPVGYMKISFHLKRTDTVLTRRFDPAPFVPSGKEDREARCEEILMMQAMGLKKRMEHIGSKRLVVGISGGLDSTLALLVMAKTCDLRGLSRACITAVTMPGFGTTGRTYRNACALTQRLGAELLEVDIRPAVEQHFRDIGQDRGCQDVTYENSQARERTQILMDLANKEGGLLVGTGDLSELALGWATYNGDHMSMYGVNCSVPKTLVRHLVRYYADTCGDAPIREVLLDVLDTPVSPELLPPKEGEIAQRTEDLVGPYELHDFFLYYVMRFGFAPGKLLRVAEAAFTPAYSRAELLKWLKVFYRRFFAQQFKRSCLPDGPKVGSVALSPRGDLRMPSDACAREWLEELEKL